jgi:membrane fusion protein (multidrug efflux system)
MAEGGPEQDIFRREALEHHARPRQEGDILRLTPGWTRATFWLLLIVVAGALVYALVGRVNEYATGPAVVRVEGKIDVTARVQGVVASVEIVPGERVAAGQVLVRFHVVDEAAEADRARREFELMLVKVLGQPSDEIARASLGSLRAAKELAEARLAQRIVRAPADGIVTDVRVRAGQQALPGDVLASLVGPDARFTVVALLPGQYRPLLRRGGPMRLELTGFRYTYRAVTIDIIGDQVIGPAEVARVLGKEIADAVPTAGPAVAVTARLPSGSFAFDGRDVRYYDGMVGTCEARVRSETVLVTLVPGLRWLFGNHDG